MPLTEEQKQRIIQSIEQGTPLSAHDKQLLFPDDAEYVERTAVYELQYKGKKSEPDILSRTPAAPLQEMRSFNSDNPFEDDWRNLLIFGDNLLALKAIYNDQRGANRYGTKNKIKLVYIDPPFATKQDFMKDREKAYRDKVTGAQFIEFIRERLVLLREVLADDGSICVHLDWKKGHYIKAIMDEVFGEQNFLNEIIWQRTYAHSDANKFGQVHEAIFIYRKTENHLFNKQFTDHSNSYIQSHYGQTDEDGRKYRLVTLSAAGHGEPKLFGDELLSPPSGRHWAWSQERIDKGLKDGKIVFSSKGQPNIKQFLDETEGTVIQSIWKDIPPVNPVSKEILGYPTQKPE